MTDQLKTPHEKLCSEEAEERRARQIRESDAQAMTDDTQDIVGRLRKYRVETFTGTYYPPVCKKAADLIEAQAAEIEMLRGALERIAAVKHPGEPPNPYKEMARKALNEKGPGD